MDFTTKLNSAAHAVSMLQHRNLQENLQCEAQQACPSPELEHYQIVNKTVLRRHDMASQYNGDIQHPLLNSNLGVFEVNQIGLCESSFLLLEYSVEYLIEYLSTRLIPEVAVNHRVVRNKRTPGSSFEFVI